MVEKTAQERSCFTCKNAPLCFIYRGIGSILEKARLNIDSDDAPGKVTDVFEAVGCCCLSYEPQVPRVATGTQL